MSVENIINNPPEVFTGPCEACGVSEFQLGVKHAEERIIKLLEDEMTTLNEQLAQWSEPAWHRYQALKQAIELIKGETK